MRINVSKIQYIIENNLFVYSCCCENKYKYRSTYIISCLFVLWKRFLLKRWRTPRFIDFIDQNFYAKRYSSFIFIFMIAKAISYGNINNWINIFIAKSLLICWWLLTNVRVLQMNKIEIRKYHSPLSSFNRG